MGQAVPESDLPGSLVPDTDLPDEVKKRQAVTGPVAPEPGFLDEAKGVGMALAVPAAGAVNYVLENPVQSAATAYGALKGRQLVNAGIDYLKNRGAAAPGIDTGAKVDLRQSLNQGAASRNIAINTPGSSTAGNNVIRGPWTGTQPVAPSAPSTATNIPVNRPAPQPSIMDRASQVVRQIAANRVVQGVAKIGGTAAAALTPGNVGQNYPFPQSGPLRGSEINPATGAPWTKQELDAYRAQYGG